MTDQASLLDFGGPHARNDDPDTAKEAAGSMTPAVLNAQCAKVLAALVDIESHGSEGATAAELVMRLAYTGHSPAQNVVARRLGDLENAGKVRRTDLRRPGTSGRNLIVWTAKVPT